MKRLTTAVHASFDFVVVVAAIIENVPSAYVVVFAFDVYLRFVIEIVYQGYQLVRFDLSQWLSVNLNFLPFAWG